MIIVKDAPKGLKVNVQIQDDGKTILELYDVLYISFYYDEKSEHPDEFGEHYGVLFPDGIQWVSGCNGVFYESLNVEDKS